jgi:hypothetical protein
MQLTRFTSNIIFMPSETFLITGYIVKMNDVMDYSDYKFSENVHVLRQFFAVNRKQTNHLIKLKNH